MRCCSFCRRNAVKGQREPGVVVMLLLCLSRRCETGLDVMYLYRPRSPRLKRLGAGRLIFCGDALLLNRKTVVFVTHRHTISGCSWCGWTIQPRYHDDWHKDDWDNESWQTKNYGETLIINGRLCFIAVGVCLVSWTGAFLCVNQKADCFLRVKIRLVIMPKLTSKICNVWPYDES